MSTFVTCVVVFLLVACNTVSVEDYKILEERVRRVEQVCTVPAEHESVEYQKKLDGRMKSLASTLDKDPLKPFQDLEDRVIVLEDILDYVRRDHNRHHLVELLYFDQTLENHGSGIYQVVGEEGNKLRKLTKLGSTFPDVIITIQELSHVQGLAQHYNSECVYYLDVWQTNEIGVRWLKSTTLVYPTFSPPCIAEEDLQVHKEIFSNQQIFKSASPFEELER